MADKSSWGKVLALGLLVTGGTSFFLAQSSADAASAENQILLKVHFALVDSGAKSVLESKLTSFDRSDQALNGRTLRPDPNLDSVLAGLQSPGGGLRMNIRLSAKPEVRTIDGARSTRMKGFIIPALETRRMEPDIELSEGQSFVISGLMDDAALETIPKIPGLLEQDPILSAIFKSGNKSDGKLAVIVTAEILAPKLAQYDQRAAVARRMDSGF
jgi:hypothetical protein